MLADRQVVVHRAVLPTARAAYVKSEGEVLSAEIAVQPLISAG
jgi:hypothetical protein